MSVQIEWVDVRKDKTTNSTYMRAEYQGKVAEVWTLPRDGSGRDWGVEVNGERVGKGFFTDKGAFAAAKKRLLAS